MRNEAKTGRALQVGDYAQGDENEAIRACLASGAALSEELAKGIEA